MKRIRTLLFKPVVRFVLWRMKVAAMSGNLQRVDELKRLLNAHLLQIAAQGIEFVTEVRERLERIQMPVPVPAVASGHRDPSSKPLSNLTKGR